MKIRVYNAKGREAFLSEGQTAPAGWFMDGRPPVELTREHRVTVHVFQGEDLDMDEDRNVRRVAALVPVWTPEEIATQAKANDVLRAKQAAHEILVAECAAKNATATAAKPAETTTTEDREVGSGYGRHSRHGGLEALGEKPHNKADVDWAFDARNSANAWND